MRYALATVFCFFVLRAGAQTGAIEGRVVDAKTLLPLPFANVFINNTTIGTSAGADGDFLLTHVPVGSNEVVFSFVGYQAYQTRVVVREGEVTRLSIKLIQDEKQLDAVEVVGTRDKEWQRQLERFKKILLGTTPNAIQCRLVNPWVLEFFESNEGGMVLFTAKAQQPLEVINLALGYRVVFYLKDFRAGPQNYSIIGNFRFEQLLTDDVKTSERWTQNRRLTYDGSDRHLLWALLNNRLQVEGFRVYEEKEGFKNTTTRSVIFSQELGRSLQNLNTEAIVGPGRREGEARVRLPKRLEVHYVNRPATKRVYRDVPHSIAWLELSRDFLDVTDKGVILNSADVFLSGYMSSARLADLLPFDYQPAEVSKNLLTSATSQPAPSRLELMQEKIFVHLDRSCYYQGDYVWLKGYLKYREPLYADSLSRVAYVELFNSSKKLVSRHAFAIDSGRFAGQLKLPDTLTSGEYYFRSYTRWMLNYMPQDLFVCPLYVLAPGTALEIAGDSVPSIHLPSSLRISIDLPERNPVTRQLLAGKIRVQDGEGNPLVADFSMAVTSLAVVPSAKRQLITDQWAWTKAEEGSSAAGHLLSPEFGLTLSGTYYQRKGKPAQAQLSVVLGELPNFLSVETDAGGQFRIENLIYYDTLKVGFRSADPKQKVAGSVRLDPPTIPPLQEPLPTLQWPASKKSENAYRPYVASQETRVLEEVVVRAQKLDDSRKQQGITYGEPDHVVNGEDLIGAAGGSIVPALQGRIPGLQVVSFWDELGIQRYKIRIRGGSSSFGNFGTTEPLLLVDGVPMMDGGYIADQIAAIDPNNVARVEVMTRANPLFGVRGTNGVIAIYTKSADPANLQPSGSPTSGFQVIPVNGLAREEKFLMPDYSKPIEAHQFPDYRATVYWSPWNATNSQGEASFEFFSSDFSGNYLLEVTGVTIDGEPFYARWTLPVLPR